MVSEYKKGGAFGADDIYPVIVYALIKAKVPKIKSNIKYIQLYRHKTRLESEEEYYFTTLYSAISFIETISYDKLNLSKEEFLYNIRNRLETRQVLYKEKENIKLDGIKLHLYYRG